MTGYGYCYGYGDGSGSYLSSAGKCCSSMALSNGGDYVLQADAQAAIASREGAFAAAKKVIAERDMEISRLLGVIADKEEETTAARQDALEEAAKVAQEQQDRTCIKCDVSYAECGEDCSKIAEKIRALAQQKGKDDE